MSKSLRSDKDSKTNPVKDLLFFKDDYDKTSRHSLDTYKKYGNKQ